MRALLVLLALVTTTSASHAETVSQTSDAPRPVVTEIVTSVAGASRVFPGTVVAKTQTTLAFQTSGVIADRPFGLGDAVEAGEKLAWLDQTTLSQDMVSAEAAESAARARSELALQIYERTLELNRRGVTSDQQLEAARAERDSASAALDSATASFERSQDAERFSTLLTPEDGTVIAVHAEPGAVATAGMPILTLAAGEDKEVLIDIPGDLLEILEPGSPFLIAAKAPGSEQVQGTFRLAGPVTNVGARTRRIYITLVESNLRIGTLVDARLNLPPDALLTLPLTAVSADRMVWRVGAGRRLEQVVVQTGPTIGSRIVVVKGLSDGDEILVRGIHSVTPGQVVGAGVSQ